jgi:hypothetical protein
MRLILKSVAVLLVLVILLVLAAPTIISSSAGRSILVDQVNKHLNGKLAIASMSMGWFTGVKIDGLHLLDASGSQIAELDHLAVPMPLWKVLTGNYALGEVPIDGLDIDARYDAAGKLNFSELAKPADSSKSASTESTSSSSSKSSKLPNLSGHLKLTRSRITISRPSAPTVYVTDINGDLAIPDINSPVTDTLGAMIKVGNDPARPLTASGTLVVIKGNELLPGSGIIHQKLDVQDLNLAAARTFMANSSDIKTLQGLLNAHLAIDIGDAKSTGITADINTRDLKYQTTTGPAIDEPSMQLNITGGQPGGQAGTQAGSQESTKAGGTNFDTIQNLAVTFKAGDAKEPTVDLLAQVPSATLSGSIAADFKLVHLTANLAKLQKEFAAVASGQAGTIVNNGLLHIASAGRYDGNTLTVDSLTIDATNLSVDRQLVDGKHINALKDETLNISAAATVDLGKTGGDRQVTVRTLTVADSGKLLDLHKDAAGDFVLTLPANGGLGGHGTVVLALQIATLDQIATILTQTDDKAAPPQIHSGKVSGTIALSPSAASTGINAKLTADDLSLNTAGGVTAVKPINVSFDGKADQSSSSIAINDAGISSEGLNLTVHGGSINHVQTTREIQLSPTLDYDLAKLWPVVQPFMGDKYKTLKISGQFKKVFNITGSYPAGVPMTTAIKSLHADGDLDVATFDYDGLNLQNFVVPIAMDQGKAVTVYAGKPAAQNTAAPAVANKGSLDLSNWTIDLAQDPPRLSIPANKVIMKDVTINPLFANTIMANIINNPVFAGSGASGLFSCTCVDCTDIPLGSLVTETVAANTGKADLKFSITGLHIGVGGLPGLDQIMKRPILSADVKDGTLSVAKGISKQHISFATGPYSLDFDGTVPLADQTFSPMNLSIGPLPGFIAAFTGGKALGGANDRIVIPVEGSMSHPHVAADKVLKAVGQAVAGNAGDILKGVLGGDKNNNPLKGLPNPFKK